jgi:hypothetical protein
LKQTFTILSLLIALLVNAQTEQENVIRAMKELHKAMVDKNFTAINQQTDKALSYGHSNGWIETKEEIVKHIDSGLVIYNSIIEDSLSIVMDSNLATVRFIGDYDVTMNGVTGLYHIRVLEIWVKKGKQWLLFARQAIK